MATSALALGEGTGVAPAPRAAVLWAIAWLPRLEPGEPSKPVERVAAPPALGPVG
jgi:hypothetical protein